MKKIISLIVCLVIFSGLSVKADSWDDFSNLDRIWDGQKSITNQEFEQVMEKLEENVVKEPKKVGEGVGFERIRRITGYLVGTVDRFNNGKRAEEKDRVKHTGVKELMCNKNPLSFIGTINRLPYFITKLALFVIASIPVIYKSMSNHLDEIQFMFFQAIILQIVFVLAFYAASKRLRDIQWSQWLLIIWAIPYVGLVIGFPLLFVKSKINDTLNQE